MEISKTDIIKAAQYLDAAAKLYEALPMQSMKCRAHMIRALSEKIKKQIANPKR